MHPAIDAIIQALESLIGQGEDVLGITPGTIAESFIAWLVSAIAQGYEYAFAPIFELICSPISFDFAADLTLGFQGAALSVVFVVIVGRGITKGVVGSATDDDMDVVRYVWRSLLPIGAVILAPTAAAMITTAAAELMGYVAGAGALGGFAHNLAELTLGISAGTAQSAVDASAALPDLPGLVFALIASIAVLWNVFALTLEILKRWIQLAMMSVIIPLTAITTAIEDSADVIGALKTMVGIVVTILLQIMLFVSAAGIASARGSLGMVATVFLFIAVMSAARALPGWIDKFTYASAIGGGSGAGRALIVASRFLPKGAR